MAGKGPPWIVHIDKMGKYGHTRSILEFNPLLIGSDRLMAYAWLPKLVVSWKNWDIQNIG